MTVRGGQKASQVLQYWTSILLGGGLRQQDLLLLDSRTALQIVLWDRKRIARILMEDDLIESLLTNIDLIDQEPIREEHKGVEVEAVHPVIYVQKRKYQWKLDPPLRRKKSRKATASRNDRISFPRILKSDIRRRYSLMYANVMNSYDYDLISSFFCKYMKPNIRFEKRTPFLQDPITIAEGVDVVLKYFLVLLQGSPDRTLRVSEINLKQSAKLVGCTEITCKFSVDNSILYELRPEVMRSLLVSILPFTPRIRSPNPDSAQTAKDVFDPIEGSFLRSRVRRLETPHSFQLEGYLTLVVDENKWIEAIVVNNMRKKGCDQAVRKWFPSDQTSDEKDCHDTIDTSSSASCRMIVFV